MRWLGLSVVIVLGCGPGGSSAIDAGIDARETPDAAAVREHREVVTGAGRISGGTITGEVEVGGPAQTKATGGTFELEGAAVVKPKQP